MTNTYPKKHKKQHNISLHKNNILHIGIDAKLLLSEANNGISQYIEKSLEYLIQYPAKFYLYGCSPSLTSQKKWQKSNVLFRTQKIQNRFYQMLWFQTTLPYLIQKDNLDIFWGTAHKIPLLLTGDIAKIVTIHDLVWKYASKTMKPLNRLIDATLMPQSIKQSDTIIAVSKSTAKDLIHLYPKEANKIKIIYPGANTLTPTHNNISNHQQTSRSTILSPYILVVGTLEPRKNLYRLINAFASISKNNPTISLVIAGKKGWGNVPIEKWITALDLHEKVFVLGSIPKSELAQLYKNCLFLAMPSLYEGFGLPIIEAMSYGKSVLTSNISSMPEISRNASVLINPLDENDIKKGLNILLDAEKRHKLEIHAKENAAIFCWKKSADNLWRTFQLSLRKNE